MGEEQVEAPPLRISGGISGALSATLQGLWGELLTLILLNTLWFLLSLTILAAPPATAALFLVARRVLAARDAGWGVFWSGFRASFVPAWKWGALFSVITAMIVANLWYYGDAPGTFWLVLRVLWLVALVVWLVLNLFYWPLWYAQEEASRTVRITLRNSLFFILLNPLPSLVAALGTALLVYVCGFFLALLITLFMVCTALLATSLVLAHLPRTDA